MSGNVDTKNIALGQRTRKTAFKRKSKSSPANKKGDLNIKVAVPALKLNDRVKMKTCRFGVKYAKGKSKFTYGTITEIDKGKIADVKWETVEGEPISMSAHVSHLQRVSPILKILSKIMNGKDGYKWPLKRTELMFSLAPAWLTPEMFMQFLQLAQAQNQEPPVEAQNNNKRKKDKNPNTAVPIKTGPKKKRQSWINNG
jgi:hypothetical protein